MIFEVGNLDSLLLPCVAVADGDGFVFKRLVIDGDAERRSDLVLPRVEFADAACVVLDGAHRGL